MGIVLYRTGVINPFMQEKELEEDGGKLSSNRISR